MSSAAHPTPALLQPRTSTTTLARSSTSTVPWYIWTGAVAVTCASIGGAWDVSWHRSIGRDSFWTPAHLMIQACGVLAAIIGLWLVSSATFGRSEKSLALRAASVDIFGLYAPLGIFVAAWGGIAMITSAPFDNWWHNAYGLDVKIISPPHTLLILGIRSVSVGVMLLILAAMNRAAGTANPAAAGFTTLQRLFLYLGGLAVGGQMFFLQAQTWDVVLHESIGYIAMGIALPVLFATLFEASRFRWAATTTAGIYMAVIIAEILILPLFPATPKLGPVFYQVTHLVPAKFPVLLIFPAFALDLFWQRARTWKPWQIAIVSGIIFVAILVAVEWPFAKFLMSPFAENRFFGSIYFDYSTPATGYERTHRFFQPESGMVLARGLLIATTCAIGSTWIGLRFGRWMRGVQR
jgi:hypothetical protein